MSPVTCHDLPTTARYAEVLLDLPLASPLSYRIPERLIGHIHVGSRVWVPLRDRRAVGCVVGLAARCRIKKVKPLDQVIDETPMLSQELLALSRWVAETTCTSWGEALFCLLPGPLRRGLTQMRPRVPWQAPPMAPTQPPRLTSEQDAATQRIGQAIDSNRHEVFLLHGVTGSGKTEVYLHAIRRALQRGKGSIVLVPEIALTPQTIERFTARFGPDQVAVLHSAMRESHRFLEWQRIARAQARIVIGARSAVFAPIRDLGLIVVDEEQEGTYKQEDAPRYHAREVAVARGSLTGASVILGSATPSLESFYRAGQGRYTLLTLTERIDHQPLPSVEIVDMRRQAGMGRPRVFSHQLESALSQVLADRQQAILFLNRRGFATLVQCAGCGTIARCPSCQVALVFHQTSQQLLCHTCRRRQPMPEICTACRGGYVRLRGMGTERVESELARLFPAARIARMDTDAMRPRGSQEAVLGKFRRGELDVLFGTQMVAKGHDFPQVTLIGIVNADTALNLPDFRAAERTFGLLTQVAGRAGRGTLPGRVIVQTWLPDHYAIVAASHHDYHTFYQQETAYRRTLRLPPFTAIAQLTICARKEARAEAAARRLAERLRLSGCPANALVGPSPSPVYRIRGLYRWQVLVKATRLATLVKRLAPIRGLRFLDGAHLVIDVDPWSPW